MPKWHGQSRRKRCQTLLYLGGPMNTQKVNVALIGAGQRGKDVYGQFAKQFQTPLHFIAVVEPNPIKRNQFREEHNISSEYAFENWNDLFSSHLDLHAVIIASPDDKHYEPAKAALNAGLHVLLEKPMSNDAFECYDLGEVAKQKGLTFMICHVLRYTPFFGKLKSLIDEGAIGELVSIQHNENISFFHMAHSFVRGNWRNSQESSPIILAKSCHDMDILHYLTGSKCSAISSFGTLSHFTQKNAPENAGSRCYNCAIESNCIYSAYRQYLPHIGKWPTTVISEFQTKNAVTSAIENGPYGRCVYACDNDVCDHQVTNMIFENGVTATFNLSAFTEKVHRTIKIMGTKGEIKANDLKNEISLHTFGESTVKVFYPQVVSGGHGGGDHQMMFDFIELIQNGTGKALTSAAASVHSHLMSFAAEQSRLEGRIIKLEAFEGELHALLSGN